MILDIQTRRLRTIGQLRANVEGNEAVDFQPRDRDEAYGFVRDTLTRFSYRHLGKRDKGIVLRFLVAAATSCLRSGGPRCRCVRGPYGLRRLAVFLAGSYGMMRVGFARHQAQPVRRALDLATPRWPSTGSTIAMKARPDPVSDGRNGVWAPWPGGSPRGSASQTATRCRRRRISSRQAT